MRYVLMSAACLAALAVAGCSKSESGGSSSAAAPSRKMSYDVAPTDGAAPRSADDGPGVDVTAAPGVAFDYRYAFRLPAEKLGAAQEIHAQACEKLGVTRCRITGMRYRLNGENSIEGSLQFKLDPTLARAFGKQGVDAIVSAGGKLIDAEITGTDAGAEIAKLQSLKAQADAELARLDKELARTDLKTAERSELQSQRAALVDRINNAKGDTKTQEESLATTPMTFEYESGPAVQGFDTSAPINSAANIFVGSMTVTLGLVLTFLAAFIPPAIVILAGFLLWRTFRRRKPAPPTSA